MKMIDVLVKQANKEIEDDTILKVLGEELFGKKAVVLEFEFYKDNFYPKDDLTAEELYSYNTDFLNAEVELIPPKEKKYRIKFNMRGFCDVMCYLNYNASRDVVCLYSSGNKGLFQDDFTKNEMQSIQPVREFLEAMEGKYELVEVEENEDD